MGKPIPVQGSPLGGLLRLLRRFLFFRRHRGFLLLFPLIFQFFGHRMGSMSWQGRRVPLVLWMMIIAMVSTESEWPRGLQKNEHAMDATVAFDDLFVNRWQRVAFVVAPN